MGKESELLEAARTGDVVTIEKLLSTRTKSKGLSAFASLRKGLSPNTQDANGDTPLHIASLNGHGNAVETLLRLDASANMMDNKGCYPLHLAAWTGNHEICHILLTQGPSIAQNNEKNNEGDTALHYACQYGHTQTVAVLLQKCVDLKLRNKRNESPLDLAAQYGHLDCVKLLLLHDVSLIQDKTATHTPLHLAARNGHKHIVKELIDAGFDIDTITESGSALHEAVLYGKQDVIRVLLEHEIDAELKDKEGNTALHNLERHTSERTLETKQIIQDYIANKKIPILDRVSAGQQQLEELYDVPSTLTPIPVQRKSMYDKASPGQKPVPTPRRSGVPEASFDEGKPPPDTSPPDIPKLTRAEATSSIYDVPAGVAHLLDSAGHTQDPEHQKPLKGYVLMSPANKVSSVNLSPSRSPEVPQKPPRRKVPLKQGSSEHDSEPPKSATPTEKDNGATKPPSLEFDKKRESKTLPQSPTGYTQPPTPDFPPPSPHAAVIGIQEKINPNDKRRSADIETSTESKYLPPTPDSIDSSIPSDKSSSSLADTEKSEDLSPLESDKSEQSVGQEVETYDNFDTKPQEMNTPPSESKNKPAKKTLEEQTEKVNDKLKDEKDNNNESTKKKNVNLNPFLGLIKGSNPKGTRRVATQLYDNVNPQQIQRQGTPSKRTSMPLNYAHFDPVPIKEKPEPILEVGDTQVMMRPKKQRESTRNTRVDTNNGTAKEEVLDDDAEWAQIADIMASFGGGITRESVFLRDFGDSMKEFFSGGKVIQSVGDWLDDIGLAQYENAFVANGFDDMDFLGANVLDDNDLSHIGVLNESHRRKILTAAKNIPPVIPIGEGNMPVTVEEWLQSLRLQDYKDNFLSNQFMNMERVRKIWELELNVLDITVLGHKKRILASLGDRPGEEKVESFQSSQRLDWSSNPMSSVAKSSEDGSFTSSCDKDLDFFKDYSGVKPKYEGSPHPSVSSPSEVNPIKYPAIPDGVFSREGDGVEADLLRIRPPQLTAMQSPIKQWRHKPEVLIKGCCNYSSQYLGSCLVKSLQGTDSTKEGIKKMKKSTENVTKTPQIMLSISYRGVKFIDAKSRRVVSEHEVSNIFCACQDGTDLNYFAYITKDLQTNNLYCHVFRVKTMELAAEIILTLGEAFEVAYQVAMKEKAAASAMEFERKLSESGASSSGAGTL